MILVGLLATAVAADDVSDMRELRNTGPWFVAGEFVASGLVGFLLPDLVLGEQPETITCADAWCEVGGFDTAMRDLLGAGNPRPIGTVSRKQGDGATLVPTANGFAIVGEL